MWISVLGEALERSRNGTKFYRIISHFFVYRSGLFFLLYRRSFLLCMTCLGLGKWRQCRSLATKTETSQREQLLWALRNVVIYVIIISFVYVVVRGTSIPLSEWFALPHDLGTEPVTVSNVQSSVRLSPIQHGKVTRLRVLLEILITLATTVARYRFPSLGVH